MNKEKRSVGKICRAFAAVAACGVCVFTQACAARVNDGAFLDDVITRENFDSVYGKIGRRVQISDVWEDEKGLAHVQVDGTDYELGMDFLSMAMVYNAKPSGKFLTATDAYNEWWRLYMQRWNYLVPEVPLYSNQYYDVYNGKIEKLETSPYWGVEDAIVGARVLSGDNSVILGSNTDLTGLFRNAAFGKSVAGAADLDIERLTSGYSTVITDMGGSFAWADTQILRKHEDEMNGDGTRTFTLTIADGLVFSDGTPIKAENYIAALLAGSTPIMREAGGSDAAGLTVVGYDEFKSYDGTGEEIPFSGVRLLDEYTFSVTVKEEYADYYYAMQYSAFTPVPTELYLGDYHIVDGGKGAYIERDFYKKTVKNGAERYVMSDVIERNMNELSAQVFPYSGPYIVESFDRGTRVATLKRNPLYKGDIRGKAQIERISYVKIVTETQLDQLKKGRVDVLSSVTGGEETKAALSVVDGVRFKETHYDRAGYGKLAFRCDFSPTQFTEVRRAIMRTIDRNEFAQTFTGGYGSVVDAPYYVGSDAYLAVKDRMKLNRYTVNIGKAKEELEKGGWIYDSKGNLYDEQDERRGAVRYKKLQGYEKSFENLGYASTDNKYRTVKIDGEYYMPLAINWIGTQPNPVTEQLITAWQNNPNAGKKIGMYITYTASDMTSALYGEYSQMPAYGFRRARYGAVNFATGFTDAAYDQSFAWTIDPIMYSNYSTNYLLDSADFLKP